MIEINLLPVELRKKQKKVTLKIPKEFIVVLSLGFLAVFLLFHLLLQAVIVIKSVQLKGLNKSWVSIQPQKKQIDELKEQINKLKVSDDAVFQVAAQRLINVTELNIISDSLSKGVWLTELSLSRENIDIKGSCVSASAQELSQIGKFLAALKSHKKMTDYFPYLELVYVQRSKISAIEIIDFVISSKAPQEIPKAKITKH